MAVIASLRLTLVNIKYIVTITENGETNVQELTGDHFVEWIRVVSGFVNKYGSSPYVMTATEITEDAYTLEVELPD